MGFFKNLFRKFSQPEPEPMASNSLDISISSEYGKQVEGRPDLKKSFNENDRSNHYTKIYKTTKQWLVDHEII